MASPTRNHQLIAFEIGHLFRSFIQKNEEHREEITLHKAAKEAFSQIKGPLPKIRELNEEYERVLREKKQTYAEYRQARQDMKDYQTAKYNVEQFLRKEEEERQAETRKRTEQVR